jgi:hypothetical protein
MSDERYEIAFSGQIADGADLEQVKQNVARVFKADDQRLAQLFSGKRVLIKREVDALTMAKYRGAFEKAGAVCEIRALNDDAPGSSAGTATPTVDAQAAAATTGANASSTSSGYQSKYPESDAIPQALLTDPLGIRGDQIDDLQADIAPVGTPLLYEIREVPEAQFDLSGLDVAPVGSDLSDGKQETPPPLPDTSGLTLAD